MKLLTILILTLFASVSDAQVVRTKYSKGNPAVRPNQLPVANAGIDRTITLPTSSTIFVGSGTDSDGTITAYSWTQISGPSTATMSVSLPATLTASNLIQGTYIFRLKVTDNKGDTAIDESSVIVNGAANIPPVANAGTDSTITLPVNSVHLLGSGTDADGTISSYQWTQSSGPAFGVITTPNNQNTTVIGLSNGVYKFQLKVTDNLGAIGIDEVIVTVLFAPAPSGDWSGRYVFSLDTVSHGSIGIFRQDSILVKTIVNDTIMGVGTHTLYWNGTDDYGNAIQFPDSSYVVKVQSNNVQYTWQGVIGNTSDNQTGSTVHRGYYHCMRDLVFTTTYGYFCTGYSEGSASRGKFAVSTPNTKIEMATLSGGKDGADVNYVTTDGTNVYWGALDANSTNNTFVFATTTASDAEVNFASGVNYTVQFGRTYRAIAYLNKSNAIISGLALSGSYLITARAGIDSLYVSNKTTGALVQRLYYDSCRALSVDGSGNLWMATGSNTFSKYTVNVDGTLIGTGVSISGLISPMASKVNGSVVGVCDAGNSQQVKFYNNTTGAFIDTLGTPNGYFADATVNDNKFYFTDINGVGVGKFSKHTFVAYQTDGSFWVGDPGNFRVQHYNSSKVYLNRIMSLGATYATYPDKNNINKVFRNFLEFEVDYSVQTLTGTTGWLLKRNWGANMSTATYDINYSPKFINTLSNGRTYGLMARRGNAQYEVIEFPSTNLLRTTGLLKPSTAILCDDGSIQDATLVAGVVTARRFALTGFNGSDNPIWAATSDTLARGLTNLVTGNPIVYPSAQSLGYNNKFVWYNYKGYANIIAGVPIFPTGYHIGVMQKGANNTYLSQTGKSTHRNYQGEFPGPGWFEEGNNVNDFAGGAVSVVDTFMLFPYHGEFWKNGQTNKFNFHKTNSLAIGQFGTTRSTVGFGAIAAAQMAGNALSPVMVKDGSGNLYVYHGDESDHPGVHRWKITRLNTITEQNITIKFTYGYVAPTLAYTDLTAGVQFNATLPNGFNGWTRFPVRDTVVNPYTNNWQVYTSLIKYDPQTQRDIQVRFSYPVVASDKYIQKDLGTNNVSSDWKITGNIVFPGGVLNGGKNNAYIEVLDDAGKLLTTFSVATNIVSYPTVIYSVATGNTVNIFNLLNPTGSNIVSAINPFEISIVSGVVTFTYAGYSSAGTTISDGTGDWRKPKIFKVRTAGTSSTNNQNYKVVLSDLKFYKDYL